MRSLKLHSAESFNFVCSRSDCFTPLSIRQSKKKIIVFYENTFLRGIRGVEDNICSANTTFCNIEKKIYLLYTLSNCGRSLCKIFKCKDVDTMPKYKKPPIRSRYAAFSSDNRRSNFFVRFD